MGHLVCFAAIRGLGDPAALHGIDPSLPWRAFAHDACGLALVEWLQRPNRNNPPPHNRLVFPPGPEFGRRPAGTAFKSDFGAAAPGLDDLIADLRRERTLSSLPAVAIHVALMLSGLAGRPVLSICSDDDDWDLACEAQDGRLERLAFRAEDEEIRLGEDGAAERLRLGAGDKQALHRIAEREAGGWCDELRPLFGFDGDPARLALRELARVDFVPEAPSANAFHKRQGAPPPRPARKPFWKFWA